MYCPVCHHVGKEVLSGVYKCDNSHVWHTCRQHAKNVVTSLIGEVTTFTGECTCYADVLNPVGSAPTQDNDIEICENYAYTEPLSFGTKQELNSVVNPTKTNPPKNISEKGREYWGEFVEKYGNVWRRYSNTEEKWKVAVAIWRNYAVKRNIPPFEETTLASDSETLKYMENRLISGIKNTLQLSENISRNLKENKFVSRVMVPTVESAIQITAGKWKIRIARKIKDCIEFTNREFREFLKDKKFYPKNGYFEREVTVNASLLIGKFGAETLMISRFILTDQLIKLALDLDYETMKNSSKVSKALIKFYRDKIKEIKKG